MTQVKPARHTEEAFEIVIEGVLLANGYVSIASDRFDRASAIFPGSIWRPWGAIQSLIMCPAFRSVPPSAAWHRHPGYR